MRSRFRRFVVVAIAAIAPPLAADAQNTGSIRGRITENVGQRAIGDVQVLVAGTGSGAITNANGEYVIANVPAGSRTVRVRRLGFVPTERTVNVVAGETTQLDFALSQSLTQLEQLVITGTAGLTEKRTLGNSITTVDVADLNEKTTVLSVSEVLQSKTPGVTFLVGSGAPGTAGEFRIRGAGSISGYRPVVFIDGVRYNIENLGNFAATGAGLAGLAQSSQTTSALDLISPNDIESIEVIKGPAAATLYGAEAANGVIQIITKKGTRGQQKLRWSFRGERGQTEWALDTPVNYTTCDSAKFAAANAATWPGCAGQSLGTVLTDEPMRRHPEALRTGDLQRLSLSVRGGGDRYSLYLAGDRDTDEGVFYNSFNNRKSARANFTFNPTDIADFQVNTSFIQTNLRLPMQDESANGLLLSAARGRPGRLPVRPTLDGWSTIEPERANRYNNQTRSERLTLGGTLNVNPWSWFRNRFTAGLDNTTAQAELLFLPGDEGEPAGAHAQRNPMTKVYTLDYAGTADFALNSTWQLTTSFGTQIVSNRTETLFGQGVGLGAPDVTLIGTATTTSSTSSFSENNSVGYYIQEQIAWNNRLFVTGAVRADDNSSFGTNFDIITYPKASVSYVISEEPGLSNLLRSWRVNSLKLRAAWGAAGRAPAPYAAEQTYTVDRVTLGGTTGSALRTQSYGNPDLKPERGQEIELGFDAGLLNERLALDFTFYNKTTSDMLVSVPVKPSTGFPTSRQTNLGEVNNRGVEFAVTATALQNERVQWDSRLSLATTRNRLNSFDIPGKVSETPTGQAYGAVQQHRPGFPMGGYWAQSPRRNADGSPVVNSAGAVQFDTAKYIGPSAPTREVGFANTVTLFKNLRFYSLLDYKGGFYLFNLKERNRCQAANDNCARNNDPRARFPQNAADSLLMKELAVWRGATAAAAWIEKADFVKLREISLTYTLPTRWLSPAGASSANIIVSGRNIGLWTDYSGIDPEVNSYGGRLFVRADAYASPMTRRLSVAINLTY
ncbi:MAG TPA: SusC/RagA family TonB-linked outer membrane protein [Gemmatimonadaceae bacterium]|nr:SusC/RagA family TonB-linked outer membrane protein [Gemmatimonadaceae bacterium]